MPLPSIQDFLGKGFAIPFRTDPNTGDIAGVEYEENVHTCVMFFLMTYQGEIVFFEDFGIPRILFSTIGPGTIDTLQHQVREGLRRYEPRIVVSFVRVTPIQNGSAHGVSINVDYRIRATGSVRSAVHVILSSEA